MRMRGDRRVAGDGAQHHGDGSLYDGGFRTATCFMGVLREEFNDCKCSSTTAEMVEVATTSSSRACWATF